MEYQWKCNSSFPVFSLVFFLSGIWLVTSWSLSAILFILRLTPKLASFLKPNWVFDSSEVNLTWLLFYFYFFHLCLMQICLPCSVKNFSIDSSPWVLHFFFFGNFFSSSKYFYTALFKSPNAFVDSFLIFCSFMRESNLLCFLLTWDPFSLSTLARFDTSPFSSFWIFPISFLIYFLIRSIQLCPIILCKEGLNSGSNCKISTIRPFSSLLNVEPS